MAKYPYYHLEAPRLRRHALVVEAAHPERFTKTRGRVPCLVCARKLAEVK